MCSSMQGSHPPTAPAAPEQCLVLLCRLMEHTRVDGCRQQVVGRADRVDVTREVEVELLHGDNLMMTVTVE